MNILFMCVANSARSQMAEGIAKSILGSSHNIQSAGSEPSGKVHLNAILALSEIGIDATNHYSKSIDQLDSYYIDNLDYVITLCAEEACPVLSSNALKLHWFNEDPADETLDEKGLKDAFNTTRDNLQKMIEEFKRLNVQ
ncbi:arsenate reductase ArsC [Gammaproteobacteria bacterium]|nr:arsenate reductase ArsC [Gammaproteobacteria bacterium]